MKEINFLKELEKCDRNSFRRQKLIIAMVKKDKRVKNIEFNIECGADTFANPVFEISVKGKVGTFLYGKRKYLCYKWKKYNKEMMKKLLNFYKEEIIGRIINAEDLVDK